MKFQQKKNKIYKKNEGVLLMILFSCIFFFCLELIDLFIVNNSIIKQICLKAHIKSFLIKLNFKKIWRIEAKKLSKFCLNLKKKWRKIQIFKNFKIAGVFTTARLGSIVHVHIRYIQGFHGSGLKDSRPNRVLNEIILMNDIFINCWPCVLKLLLSL